MKNQRLVERKQTLKELARGSKKDSYCYRHQHIAYCMARGRKYLEIENKVHDHNILSKWEWERLNEDIAYLKEGFNEDVHISA